MSNRILDYPEATAITSDDYILLDNEGTGAKCIKASALNINMDNYTIKEARGAIASFDDGEDLPLAFMGAYITAIQDLHGYDYPWVGGSGKNKFNIATISVKEYIGENGNIYSSNNWSVSDFTSVDSETAYVLSGITNSGSLARHIFYDSNKVFISAINSTVMNFTTPSNAKYIRLSLQSETPTNVQLEKGSTATTWQPYSNICPISGWSGVEVTRCGKNWFDVSTYVSGNSNFTKSGETFSNSITDTKTNFKMNAFSVDNNDNLTFIASDIISSTGQKVYSFSISSESKIWIKHNGATQDLWLRFGQKLPTGSYKLIFNVDAYNPSTTNGLTISNIMVIASTETNYTFKAYNGHTYTLTFTDGTNPLIVYGGYVDLVSGVLTVDRVDVDLGTLSWGSASNGRVYSSAIADIKPITASSTVSNIMCSNYATVSARAVYDKTTNGSICIAGAGYGGDKCIGVYDSSLVNKSASEVAQAMNGVQLVYELATPLTYQLSKQQIRSLVGENKIFADTGDSVVDYRKLWLTPEM